MLDQPGTGEALRLHGLTARLGAEAWAGAAVDWLQARPDVDPARIGTVGWSLGGYYAPRAMSTRQLLPGFEEPEPDQARRARHQERDLRTAAVAVAVGSASAAAGGRPVQGEDGDRAPGPDLAGRQPWSRAAVTSTVPAASRRVQSPLRCRAPTRADPGSATSPSGSAAGSPQGVPQHAGAELLLCPCFRTISA